MSHEYSPQKIRQSLWFDIALVSVAFIWFVAFNAKVPGLHLDEAWVMLRTTSILHGERPINGMNAYSGAPQQYLLALWGLIFGVNIATVRAFSALLISGAVFLFIRSLRRLNPSPEFILSSAAFIVFLPIIQVSARIAIEVTSFNLFLGALSLFLISQNSKYLIIPLFSGFLQGIGIWSHLLFVPFAFSTLSVLIYWVVEKKEGRRFHKIESKRLLLFTGGLIIGSIPRILDMTLYGLSSPGPSVSLSEHLNSTLLDLPTLPRTLAELGNGSILFQRYVGLNPRLPFSVLHILFVLVIFIRLQLRIFQKKMLSRIEFITIFFTFLMTIFTAFLVPRWSDRYFFSSVIGFSVCFILVCLQFEKSGHRVLRKISFLFPLLPAVYFLFSFYFYFQRPFLETGGNLLHFRVGNRLNETSSHFVNTQAVFKYLRDEGVKEIYGDSFIIFPFYAHQMVSPGSQGFHFYSPVDAVPVSLNKMAFIFYSDFLTQETAEVLKRKLREKFLPRSLREEKNIDPHFLLWIVN